MRGKIHSIQTLGTLDGPGVRFVLFMQGCPLRCGYCHNPDTWKIEEAVQELSVEELIPQILRYKEYFGQEGGLTVSGGEPLLQCEFLTELFSECKKAGISTCLDTSGYELSEKAKKLLAVTDLVLLDLKMTREEDYKNYTGASLFKVMEFMKYLNQKEISVWIRHVVVPELNNTIEDKERLERLIQEFHVIKKVEYLPFKKYCLSKYEDMGIPFPFQKYPEMETGDPDCFFL